MTKESDPSHLSLPPSLSHCLASSHLHCLVGLAVHWRIDSRHGYGILIDKIDMEKVEGDSKQGRAQPIAQPAHSCEDP